MLAGKSNHELEGKVSVTLAKKDREIKIEEFFSKYCYIFINSETNKPEEVLEKLQNYFKKFNDKPEEIKNLVNDLGLLSSFETEDKKYDFNIFFHKSAIDDEKSKNEMKLEIMQNFAQDQVNTRELAPLQNTEIEQANVKIENFLKILFKFLDCELGAKLKDFSKRFFNEKSFTFGYFSLPIKNDKYKFINYLVTITIEQSDPIFLFKIETIGVSFTGQPIGLTEEQMRKNASALLRPFSNITENSSKTNSENFNKEGIKEVISYFVFMIMLSLGTLFLLDSVQKQQNDQNSLNEELV